MGGDLRKTAFRNFVVQKGRWSSSLRQNGCGLFKPANLDSIQMDWGFSVGVGLSVLPGAFLLSGKRLHTGMGEFGSQNLKCPVLLGGAEHLKPNRPGHQIGQLKTR